MNLTARVKRCKCIMYHQDENVRLIAGATVKILPETLKLIPTHGMRVDVIPENLKTETPQPLLVRFLEMDESTDAALKQAAKLNGF